jgi:hypothetical protein
MVTTTYIGTTDGEGAVCILRQTRSETTDRETLAELPGAVHRSSPACAAFIASALLRDCLRDELRVHRLCQRFADLLISRLLMSASWILTNEDVEDAVQAIESQEGWLWLEEGFYLDQDPRLWTAETHS